MKPINRFQILSFFLFTLLVVFVQSNDDWGGCVDPADSNTLVRHGKATTICLTVGPSGNWAAGDVSTLRYSFEPKADEFSRFSVPNSYNRLVQKSDITNDLNGDLSVFVSSQSSLSFLRQYYDSESDRIFPHLTAIIDVKDGVVNGIAWDKACIFCRNDRCLENTYDFSGALRKLDEPSKGCYYTKRECDDFLNKDGTECDLTLYVVWTGSDEENKVLSSSSFRFSAYNSKKIMDTFRDGISSVTGLFNSIVDR